MNNPQSHTLTSVQTLEALNSNAQTGLSTQRAKELLTQNGPNKLEEGKKKTLLQVFFTQFADLMIWVLIAAALISGFLGEWVDASIIGIVVLINAVMGTIQESKAEAALEALKKMAAPSAKVLRDGQPIKIPAEELAVGDIVILEAGDSVPADLRLIESASLKAEESALTGESVPVEKDSQVLCAPDAPLGDRLNMTYMGTAITYGRGLGVVAATGMATQMGSIAGQLAQTKKESTPLQKKLNQISNILSIGVLAIAAVIFAIGWIGGNEPFEMFMIAVSLAVAAIPEGMVAVVTIVLAMGMTRLADKGAIIRRLPAVETLGSTQVICSDKTGTLTQNRMTVMQIFSEKPEMLHDAMAHCNDSRLDESGKSIGDPTETALIDYLLKEKLWTNQEIIQRSRAGEIPFDSDRKLSTVAIKHPSGEGLRIFVKGAPDVLLSRCVSRQSDDQVLPLDGEGRKQLEQENENMAKQALRVLAFGYKDVPSADFTNIQQTESELVFCGLTGMLDPSRPEAKEAIAVCRKAGVIPVMITGDHKTTAMAIAEDLNILGDGRKAVTGEELEKMSDQELDQNVEHIGVYARVAPEHKSRIVAAWQKKDCIVAMTGDGVNDAPALKASNIGVGMGITGTDVSKGAADMVLTDDNFATIVTAIGEGRRIFSNIHKTIRFLLSSNVGEVIAILIATILNWNFLAPIHILWINLVTDTFPALALGVEPAENDIMLQKPRSSKEAFLNRRDWGSIALVGFVQAVLALIAYQIGGADRAGTTMAFLTISLAQIFAAVGFQSEHHSIASIKFKEHPMLWLAAGASVLLQLIIIFIPPLRELFELAVLSGMQWLTVLVLCIIMLAFIELVKLVSRKRADIQRS